MSEKLSLSDLEMHVNDWLSRLTMKEGQTATEGFVFLLEQDIQALKQISSLLMQLQPKKAQLVELLSSSRSDAARMERH